MASSHKAVVHPIKILRGSLSSSPGPSSQPLGSFVLPCRKLIINYSERNPSSFGVRHFLRTPKANTYPTGPAPATSTSDPSIHDTRLSSRHSIVDLAKKYPSTEVVVVQNESREPTVTAIYLNTRSKTIPLSNLPSPSVISKIQLALDSSGRKMESINHRRRPVESAMLPARGVWSAVHGRNRTKI